MISIAIVVEYLIGHATYADALRRVAAGRDGLRVYQHDLRWPQRGAIERMWPVRANWTLRSSLRTRVLLERTPPVQAALIHTQTPAVLSVGFMRRVPTIVSTDATPLQFDRVGAAYGHHPNPEPVEQVKAAIVARGYRAAHRILTFSDWVSRSVVADYGIDPAKVQAIHPGTTLPPRRPERDRAPADPLRVLFVGGEFERKGGHDLIAALHGLSVPWQLDVVTRSDIPEGPGVAVHRQLSPDSQELARLYAEADVFALPTRGEAVPHVVVEAMAAGVPVVAADVGGIPDLVGADSGILVGAGDVPALRDALESLAHDPARARALGAGGRARAERDFDAAVNMPRILDVVVAAGGDRAGDG